MPLVVQQPEPRRERWGLRALPNTRTCCRARSGENRFGKDRGAQRSGAALRGTRPHAWLHHVAPRVCSRTAAVARDTGCTAPASPRALTVQCLLLCSTGAGDEAQRLRRSRWRWNTSTQKVRSLRETCPVRCTRGGWPEVLLRPLTPSPTVFSRVLRGPYLITPQRYVSAISGPFNCVRGPAFALPRGHVH